MYSYDENWGINTISAIQNYCNLSPFQIHYDSPSQQCCSTADMRNRCQTQQTINSLQAQTQKIKDVLEDIDATINIHTFKEEIRGNERNNPFDKSIKDYMDKEFLYKSELKEIEDEFHFKFNDLGNSIINEKNRIYKISKRIIEYLQSKFYINNLKYINKINIYEYPIISNSVYIYYNNKPISIYIGDTDANKGDEEDIINMCNVILKKDIPEYQQFYEKYKNRIVKDNEYEDLSYYEKILKKNA